MDARLIDVRTEKSITDSYCTQHANSHATYNELLADKAARLKALLSAQRDSCLAQFKVEVLNIHP
jgi:hypothetical protein